MVSLTVALTTILLNKEVSGEGPEGRERLTSRVGGGRKGKTPLVLKQEKIQVCGVIIKSIPKAYKE